MCEQRDKCTAFNRKKKELLFAVSKMDDVFHVIPTTVEAIKSAEMELQLKFADEYVYYAKSYGVVIGTGITLTGVTDFQDLNVVNATKAARATNHYLPHGMYVVDNLEDCHMYILQDRYGAIYSMYKFEQHFIKINNSLCEYIEENYPVIGE